MPGLLGSPNSAAERSPLSPFQGMSLPKMIGMWPGSGKGWLVFGGTSVATPIIASVYALAGNTPNASTLYASGASLFDVTSGSNGSCGTLLCNATTGWDGPTGNGTPNGTGAF